MPVALDPPELSAPLPLQAPNNSDYMYNEILLSKILAQRDESPRIIPDIYIANRIARPMIVRRDT
jgi:hypothetical protein